jgi:folate-binding protein YgfZ
LIPAPESLFMETSIAASALSPVYAQVIAGSGYYPLPSPGCLEVSGPDQAAFLQRQTTNDLRHLSDRQAVVSVLTSPAARILDVLTVVKTGDSLLALTLPGYGARTAQFLKSRIFFMDKVTVADLSAETGQIDLEGPHAGAALRSLGVELPPGADQVSQAGLERCTVISRPGLCGTGYRLVFPLAIAGQIQARLEAAGACPIPADVYEVLRVEAGLPGVDRELSEAYTPLEAALDNAISDTKGCYTGQEVIARQRTYDKITRRQTGLRCTQPAQPGGQVFVDGKSVGEITSAVISPRFGPIALACMRRPFFEPELDVQVGREGSPARTSRLPFEQ